MPFEAAALSLKISRDLRAARYGRQRHSLGQGLPNFNVDGRVVYKQNADLER